MDFPDESSLTNLESTFIGAASGLSSQLEMGEMVVQILSGKNAGQHFTFLAGQSVLIGRQPDCHISIEHNLISRHHSKVQWKGNEPWISDLGSTNGTFLNGESIEEARISSGDRIQVGSSVLKITFKLDKEGEHTRITRLLHNAEDVLKKIKQTEKRKGKIFSGSLEKMHFTEVLQSVALGKKEGIIVVHGPQLGKIYLRHGHILFAKSGEIIGKKALFRILGWQKGTFELRDLKDELVGEFPPETLELATKEFDGDITKTLLEYFKFEDELGPVQDYVPPWNSELRKNPKKPLPLEEGLERVAAIYRQVEATPRVMDLLDQFPLLDSEISRVLAFLIERRFLLEQKQKNN